MDQDVLLAVESVHKRFGGLVALDGVSLVVRRGRITGLIGPNGSGKTTLFNVITGFLRPERGRVRFAGTDLTGLSPDRIARLGLCRTFQLSLHPRRLTVMENLLLAPQQQAGEGLLACFLRPGKVWRQERQFLARAWELLAQVGLADHADAEAGSLSGGQQKLLALAQVLMADPQLVLLDEPTAGVNPTLAQHLVALLRTLQRQGRDFCIIEHNLRVVRRLCDEVYVLDHGQILAHGDPATVLQREEVLRAYLSRRALRAEEPDR
ncbi:MAG: ABC transporter ATP-binding protein [Candidatus Tectimicrobiota bacterium]|nr:MAG: ABC transporter ATP-binding protein [Candidatus Tectomicrobia bacterium]